MGMIRIQTWGSFPSRDKTFGPANHGHVVTVAEAIEWLASEVLTEAHERDHRLHDEGANPLKGWIPSEVSDDE